ncbi:MAG TPA: putative LPS assembly protein LptD, partial [Bacteroidia bacterium]|nr:putative LPS assembly protein LptD [Bacteroidia bacterium]
MTTFTILKYIQVTPSINTNGYLHFKSFHQRYDKDSNKVYIDTLERINFYADAQASTALSTMVYGDYFFKTKHLKQIHQVVTPSVSFVYKPDYSEKQFGYYGRYYNDSAKKEFRYPYFGNNGGPTMGKSQSINFNLNSTLEAKIKKDSDSGEVFKKIKLLESIGASLNYNAAANEALGQYKWSDLILSARTRLFDKVDVNAGAVYDLYHYEGRVKVPYLQLQYGHLASLSSFNTSISTSLRAKEKKKEETTPAPASGTPPPSVFNDQASIEEQLQYLINHGTTYVDFNVPWNLFMNYNFYYYPRNSVNIINQTLGFSGDLGLTPRWRVNFSSGFDFETLKVTNTSITIHRDLHCWEMQFMWVPFGYRQTFLLTINVKSSMLRDLQLKKQNQENQAVGY